MVLLVLLGMATTAGPATEATAMTRTTLGPAEAMMRTTTADRAVKPRLLLRAAPSCVDKGPQQCVIRIKATVAGTRVVRGVV
jgi:hypothetical protein